MRNVARIGHHELADLFELVMIVSQIKKKKKKKKKDFKEADFIDVKLRIYRYKKILKVPFCYKGNEVIMHFLSGIMYFSFYVLKLSGSMFLRWFFLRRLKSARWLRFLLANV